MCCTPCIVTWQLCTSHTPYIIHLSNNKNKQNKCDRRMMLMIGFFLFPQFRTENCWLAFITPSTAMNSDLFLSIFVRKIGFFELQRIYNLDLVIYNIPLLSFPTQNKNKVTFRHHQWPISYDTCYNYVNCWFGSRSVPSEDN